MNTINTEWTKLKTEKSTMDFSKISPSSFTMGSLRGLPIEQPVHAVRIEKPFYIAAIPVTQSLWVEVMDNNPSRFVAPENPVENVSWDDANNFCEQISLMVGKSIRLPSEAEWEYVCRAGTSSEYFFGDDDSALREYAWYDLNSNDKTHPVGQKMPNPWGLYDLVGNVWEWCADEWFSDYSSAPSTSIARQSANDYQSRRVLRGGAWDMDSFRCRSAYRSYESREIATSKFGFRIVFDE